MFGTTFVRGTTLVIWDNNYRIDSVLVLTFLLTLITLKRARLISHYVSFAKAMYCMLMLRPLLFSRRSCMMTRIFYSHDGRARYIRLFSRPSCNDDAHFLFSRRYRLFSRVLLLGLLTVNRLTDLFARIDPKSAGPINRRLSSYRPVTT